LKNRLTARTLKAKRNGEKLFCGYITLGYPNLSFTRNMILRMEEIGVDIVELGIPFSDPLADGPVIQAASEAALKKGVSPADAFRLCRDLRRDGLRLPVIFFSYYNPIMSFGASRFVREMKKAGFDGLIVPDLPPDEDIEFRKLISREGLAMVFLASPTTKDKRLIFISNASKGFIYYVSLKGVTGIRKNLSGDLGDQIRRIREVSDLPVLIGFGVSDPRQAHKASRCADGVIVGSAIIDAIRRSGGDIRKVSRLVERLVISTKSAGLSRGVKDRR